MGLESYSSIPSYLRKCTQYKQKNFHQILFYLKFTLGFYVFFLFHPVGSQVADEVYPTWDHGLFWKAGKFEGPFITPGMTIDDLSNLGVAGYHRNSCLNRAHVTSDTINDVFYYGKKEEMPLQNSDVGYLAGSTYWFNEDLHVGHVFYDIVLIQILQLMKIDRIVLQRTVCKAKLCAGIGTVDSFYKAYFAAMFEAAGQSSIPVYVRWSHVEKHVKPLLFSVHTTDLYNTTAINTIPTELHAIKLNKLMCFDSVTRSGRRHTFGSLPQVSVEAIRKFKQSAYAMTNATPPLQVRLPDKPPYKILFSHRGHSATRRISNLEEFIHFLRKAFPPPTYILTVMNNSLPSLNWRDQLMTVAESHVVITNHGAFESNIMYMRNSSLLLELFGHYGNNEIHTFHRLALMFGVFYSRLHHRNLTDHHMPSYVVSVEDMEKVVRVVGEYFQVIPKTLATGIYF